jgi:succinate-semialdehyde dehydrogenase/glutarate-semialdehyde dehydrogenase
VIIFDDCDLEKTVETLAVGKARNAGQVCVSPTRFYVQEGIHDRFVEAFAARFGRVKVGNGLDAASNMGPMANPRRPAAMEQFIADAIAKGARCAPAARRSTDGFFWRPTVLSEVPVEARVMNEEPFGPVVVTAPFKTFDEVGRAGQPAALSAWQPSPSPRMAARANLIGDAIEAAWSASTPSCSPRPTPRSAGSRKAAMAAKTAPRAWPPASSPRPSISSEEHP